MEGGGVKAEPINGSPLPQRNPKGGQGGGNVGVQQNTGNQNTQLDNDHSGIPEKKARFAGNAQGGNRGNRNRFSGGGGGGGGRGQQRNQRRQDGHDNQNQGGGNRDRDRIDDRRGGGGGGGGSGRKSDDYMINQKLKALSGATHELPPIETEETKFSGRNRLYIGNLTNDITEEELREMFKPYGEISEAFINAEKNFAFLKVDYHVNAEKAKRELDGQMRKNRALRIRFAPNATMVRVKNLTPYVSNELLFKAFEVFGPVERAVIIVDDRGKPTGEGIVEYARKAGAMVAMRYCSEKCYFLTSALRPCVVEPLELNDDTDGLSDKSMNKKTQEFFKERNVGPRFAEIGSFEHEYGTRWKQLHELFKQKHEALKRELQMEEDKLEAQMEFARYEHETELLREQLRQREQDRERQKMEWEMRERQVEELRNREEEQMRRQQEDMQMRMNKQDEELRRRQQENTLFMQAQQLNSLLDQQEMNQTGGNSGGMNRNQENRNFNFGNNMGGGNQDQQFNPFEMPPSKQNLFDDQSQNQVGGTGGGGGGQMNQRSGGGGGGNAGGVGGSGGNMSGGNRPWNDRRGGGGGDFQNKRRRF